MSTQVGPQASTLIPKPCVEEKKVGNYTSEDISMQFKSTSEAATSTSGSTSNGHQTDNKSQQTEPSKPATEDVETDEDVELFDRVLLQKLDYSQSSFKPSLLGEGLVLRPLELSDYHKNYLGLLEKLTVVGPVTCEQFKQQFERMRSADQSYYLIVVEDRQQRIVVGTATLHLERKFIHGCALRGRIEDVVVDERYRQNRIGSLLIETIRLLAQSFQVYKLSLDCKDEMVDYYKKFGYIQAPGNANTMVIRF